jgi:predicted DNA-binding transcriptional regulator AlpA
MKAPFDRPAKEGVIGKVGMAAPTIYELIRKGEFPMPVKRGRSSLWIESEIDAWIAELKEERDRERSAA